MAKKSAPRTTDAAPASAEVGPRTPGAAAARGHAGEPRPRPFPWWLVGGGVVLAAAVALGQRGERSGASSGSDTGREIGVSAGLASVPERLEVRVVQSYPHDPGAFTQGLLWHDGQLFESTGLYGESSLRRVDLESGTVRERREVEPRLFAEGLARVGGELFQLTWREHELRVWTTDGLEPVRTVEYEGEGWGLCHDGTNLVMSDGSARLTFRDPQDFHVVRTVRVRERGQAVDQLNELECQGGMIWANVWQTDRILRIDPRDGRVTGTVDAAGLLSPEEARRSDVLNGIAWIEERGHFVITGKLWPRLFEVEFVPQGRARRAGEEG